MPREVPKWETLDRDILGVIFSKFHVIDLTMGPSRVCISWFLASHNKILWNTIDLAKLQHIKEESVSRRNIFADITKYFSNSCVRKTLEDITKFSSTVPKNLFFNFDTYVGEKDLMLAAERMPNIEKLFLKFYCIYDYGDSVRFAFSQWKNLKTLIIGFNIHEYPIMPFLFQFLGESCSNLNNLKYLGYLNKTCAEKIVCYLQSLRRLSFRCSTVSSEGVLLLIRGLQNLEILNLSHCKHIVEDYDFDDDVRHHDVPNDSLIQAASHKLNKFIVCSKNNCRVCKERRGDGVGWSYIKKHFRNDEIKEFEF